MLKIKRLDNQPKLNKETGEVLLAKNNIYKQAAMAGLAIVITLILVLAMSVAWYSNVIHSESLTFETDSWDFTFDGEIVIDAAQKAAPGRNGIVPLTLKNESDDAVEVIANVSKESFSAEMEKRIFFYVDDTKVVEYTEGEEVKQEVVDRVYVNESESYTYSILGKNQLTLSEEHANAPLLKWEWVYDVLGYYVKGKVTNNEADIEDYLRPIRYDYDKATFSEPEDTSQPSELVTVDGVTTVEKFLEELSKTDGYTSDIGKTKVNGYYPVSVDANGNGIWVYLCNKGEILFANEWDTTLGELVANDNTSEEEEKLGVFTARLILTGQQKEERTEIAYDESSIAKFVADDAVDKIVLGGNMNITTPITVASNREVVFDLNEFSLLIPASGNVFNVEKDASLTLVNGSVSNQLNVDNKTNLIHTEGGQVTINGVEVEGVYRALDITDAAVGSSGSDSRVLIEDSTLSTKDVSIMIKGNGTQSARTTSLIINDSTILSEEYIGIAGNGNAGSTEAWGTTIDITGSTIEGKWAAIYHPQRMSTLNITDSTLKGYTALAVKGGTVSITSCTITGTGEKVPATFAVSGFTDTGDGIYVETNYNAEIKVTLAGENYVSSSHGYAIQVFEPTAPHASVIVTEGQFSSDVSAFLPIDGSCAQKGPVDGIYKYQVGATTVNE